MCFVRHLFVRMSSMMRLASANGVVLATSAALLAGAGLPRASASCGDYVTVGDAKPHDGAHSSSSGTPFHNSEKRPCSHPNCSGQPAPVPFAPVSPPTPPRPEVADAGRTAGIASAGPDWGSYLPHDSSLCRIYRPFRIERPPRPDHSPSV